MQNYSITLPSYSVGTEVYSKISSVCEGKSAVIIGGKKALCAAEPKIRASLGKIIAGVSIFYGGEASEENVTILAENDEVRNAEMIFAVGGGKAIDTCKAIGQRLSKPVYAFPTIASTCAATTAVAIMYHPDGSFSKPQFLNCPPKHSFIDTEIIAEAPKRYMWAGMGDTYAKYYESTVSSRGEILEHYHALGTTVSHMCVDPVLMYGKTAMIDNEACRASNALEQVVLAIIVTTGIASILLTADRVIDYNTGLAHSIFYALTSYPQIEKNHLHGEVVGFGVLLLLLCDGQTDEFLRLHSFMRSVGLPVSPGQIELTDEDVRRVIPTVVNMPDVAHNPYKITAEMLSDAVLKLKKYNQTGSLQ